MADHTHDGSMGKQKKWVDELWEETNRRYRNQTLRERIFPEPAPPRSKQPTLAELWLATAAEEDSEAEEPPSGAAVPETADQELDTRDEEAKAVVLEHVERVEEESMCRDLLTRVNLVYVPWYENVMDDTNKLRGLVQNYVEKLSNIS